MNFGPNVFVYCVLAHVVCHRPMRAADFLLRIHVKAHLVEKKIVENNFSATTTNFCAPLPPIIRSNFQTDWRYLKIVLKDAPRREESNGGLKNCLRQILPPENSEKLLQKGKIATAHAQ